MKPSEMNEQEWQERISSIRKIIEIHEDPRLKELKKHSAMPFDSVEEMVERFLEKQIDEEGKSNA